MQSSRFLRKIESFGNRIPDPFLLFIALALVFYLLSALGSAAGWSAVHPLTGETVSVVNLVSKPGFRSLLTDAVKNFAAFPPLGSVFVCMLGLGVAEKSGLIDTVLKRLEKRVPAFLLPFAIAMVGMASAVAGDAGYVIFVPLGAAIFAGAGRPPLAGLFLAFAAASLGFGASPILTIVDPVLAGFTEKAAHVVNPQTRLGPLAVFYFTAASSVFLALVLVFVNRRWIEPRFEARRKAVAEVPKPGDAHAIDPIRENRGLVAAGISAVLFLALVLLATLPETGLLRDDRGTITPFYQSLVPVLAASFFFPGVAYGLVSGSIRSSKDLATMAASGFANMGPYIALIFVASQFLVIFQESKLGFVMAMNGAHLLQSFGLSGWLALLVFFAGIGALDLFMLSATAKWAILSPFIVPMFALVEIPPDTTLAAYRVSDGATNMISPFLPYLPLVLGVVRKYEPEAGLGTLFSGSVVYFLAAFPAWIAFFFLWRALGIPFGI